MEQIWNKLWKNYLFISEKGFLKWLKNSFVLSNHLDISFCLISYATIVIYAVTESVNMQQDDISYDNVLYLNVFDWTPTRKFH